MKNKTLLITGGTGSFGQRCAQEAIKKDFQKVIIYSRHEHHQIEMERNIKDPHKKLRYFIGDVRDRPRLFRAFAGVDYIIHAAALKHVTVCERDPFEAIQTNVVGAQNVIDMAIDQHVKKVLAISTDKAVNPINLYGAAKLCADKLFIAANVYSPGTTRFSVIRYGNFANSRGSVIPYFRDLVAKGSRYLPVTDSRMTRFFITLKKAVDLAFLVLEAQKGGEVFSPKMPAFKIVDIARNIATASGNPFRPEVKFVYTGRRRGEKIHEELIISDDAPNTYDCGLYYLTQAEQIVGGIKVANGFKYTSKGEKDA